MVSLLFHEGQVKINFVVYCLKITLSVDFFLWIWKTYLFWCISASCQLPTGKIQDERREPESDTSKVKRYRRATKPEEMMNKSIVQMSLIILVSSVNLKLFT